MQLDEWRMFQITPFNWEIQNIKMSPPLISQPTADSFPPGEAKNRKQNPPPFNAQLNFSTLRASVAAPTERAQIAHRLFIPILTTRM